MITEPCDKNCRNLSLEIKEIGIINLQRGSNYAGFRAKRLPVPNLFWAINYLMIATHSDNFSPPSENVNFREGKRLATLL